MTILVLGFVRGTYLIAVSGLVRFLRVSIEPDLTGTNRSALKRSDQRKQAQAAQDREVYMLFAGGTHH